MPARLGRAFCLADGCAVCKLMIFARIFAMIGNENGADYFIFQQNALSLERNRNGH